MPYLAHELENFIEQLWDEGLEGANVLLLILLYKVAQRHGGIHFDLGTAAPGTVSQCSAFWQSADLLTFHQTSMLA